jgi:hypothetical protein
MIVVGVLAAVAVGCCLASWWGMRRTYHVSDLKPLSKEWEAPE